MNQHVSTELVTHGPPKNPAKAGTKGFRREAGCDSVYPGRAVFDPLHPQEAYRHFAGKIGFPAG